MGIAVILSDKDFSSLGLGRVNFYSDVPVSGIVLSATKTANNTYKINASYLPMNTAQRGCTIELISGSNYATLNGDIITVKPAAGSGASVQVKAVSSYDPTITYTLTVNVEYTDTSVWATGLSDEEFATKIVGTGGKGEIVLGGKYSLGAKFFTGKQILGVRFVGKNYNGDTATSGTITIGKYSVGDGQHGATTYLEFTPIQTISGFGTGVGVAMLDEPIMLNDDERIAVKSDGNMYIGGQGYTGQGAGWNYDCDLYGYNQFGFDVKYNR